MSVDEAVDAALDTVPQDLRAQMEKFDAIQVAVSKIYGNDSVAPSMSSNRLRRQATAKIHSFRPPVTLGDAVYWCISVCSSFSLHSGLMMII